MSTHVVRRLIGWLRGSRQRENDPRQAALVRRTEQARAEARKWKARTAEAVAAERIAWQRASALKRRLAGLESRLAMARREATSVDLVRQAFPRWNQTLTARVGAYAQQGREERLLAVSESYRTAVAADANASLPMALKGACDGLTWWVPTSAKQKRSGAGEAAQQRFPYRAILQTRGLATGGIMLDLGANVGRMAVPRVILGDATVVYCAEPDPINYACLARNVIENGLRGLVLPDQTAIGDRNGSVRFLRAGGHGNHRVASEDTAGDSDVVDVPCTTLDNWVERLQVDLAAVTFIKVDVEGFERRVLAGASRVLQCPHIAWQMEVKPAGLRTSGDDSQQLYADLQRAFTHFIDLNRRATGPRVRPTSELSDALGYIEPRQKTDVLLFSEG